MNITEITNKHIKIGKTSITVVNEETGKTCGLVRNIFKFKDLPLNRQISYWGQLRSVGAWGSGIDGINDAVIIYDNQLYYLHNLQPIEFFNKCCSGVEAFECEKVMVEQRKAIAENMKKYAAVINCYIDKF